MNTTAGEFCFTAERVILDAESLDPKEILNLAPEISSQVYAVKIGYCSDSPNCHLIENLKKAGFKRVWVDHKMITSPEIAGLYAFVAKSAGADILSVFAAGGAAMMRAAVENGPKEVMATILLPSHTDEDVRDIHGNAPDLVVRSLASLAKGAGVHGLVCPNKWISSLTGKEFTRLKLVVSGLIPPQKDVSLPHGLSPRSAILNSASHLFIPAWLIDKTNPRETFSLIEAEASAARRELLGIKIL